MKKKTVCYIIEMDSSIGGLIERLHDIGAKVNVNYKGNNYMEIGIIAQEDLISEVENEMAFYV